MVGPKTYDTVELAGMVLQNVVGLNGRNEMNSTLLENIVNGSKSFVEMHVGRYHSCFHQRLLQNFQSNELQLQRFRGFSIHRVL